MLAMSENLPSSSTSRRKTLQFYVYTMSTLFCSSFESCGFVQLPGSKLLLQRFRMPVARLCVWSVWGIVRTVKPVSLFVSKSLAKKKEMGWRSITQSWRLRDCIQKWIFTLLRCLTFVLLFLYCCATVESFYHPFRTLQLLHRLLPSTLFLAPMKQKCKASKILFVRVLAAQAGWGNSHSVANGVGRMLASNKYG